MGARGFEYEGIFMGKIMEWIRNYGLIAFIVIMLLGMTIGGGFIVYYDFIDSDEKISVGELLRNFILGFGVIGGGYGLHLATKRQKTFSDQVQVQVDQSFNEKLGRGVELLAKEGVSMRSAGVRILVDLAKNASEAQKPIVVNIIYDFFCEKTSVQHNNKHQHIQIPSEERGQDLQNALDFLINLSLEERRILLPNQVVNDMLNFLELDFNHLKFITKTLKNIHFFASYVSGPCFDSNTIIENIYCNEIKIERALFFNVKIRNSNFREGQIVDSNFHYCTIEETSFIRQRNKKIDSKDRDIAHFKYDLVKFVGGRFINGNIRASSTSGLPYFFGADLSGTTFNFDDDIDLNKYFELCYYRKGQRPSKMDDSREYEFICEMNVFVESNKPWSGKPVVEQVAVEVAEWKLNNNFGFYWSVDENLLLMQVQTAKNEL